MDVQHLVVSFLSGAVVTPLLVCASRKLFPPRPSGLGMSEQDLIRRNQTANVVAGCLLLLGLLSPTLLYDGFNVGPDDPRPVALGFTLSVLGPLLFLALRKRLTGRGFGELCRYAEIQGRIPLALQKLLYATWVLLAVGMDAYALRWSLS
jgi:hypothetical protein